MAYPVMSTSVPWSLVKGGFKKTPHFNTSTQKPVAGRGRTSISYTPYPSWDFEVDLNYVLGGESIQFSTLQSFLGCFIACCGSGNFFLFTDPNDSAVDDPSQSLMLNVTPGAAAPMGKNGDGTSTQFRLARYIDQGVDMLQQVSNVQLLVNGAAVSGSIDTGSVDPRLTGVVTFDVAPPVGALLTWEGSFQYLCQFADDTLTDLARVSKNSNGFLWSCSSIAFESVFV